jgi:hypothetical protein
MIASAAFRLYRLAFLVLPATATGQAACPSQIDLGQVILCSIDRPGSQRTHRFSAARGDAIVIGVTSENITPHIEVWRPDGSLSCGPGYGELTCPGLDQTGPHTIMVRDEYGSKTGDYTLSLRRQGEASPPAAVPPGVRATPGSEDGPGTNNQSSTTIVVAVIGALATIVAAWLGSRAQSRRRQRK